MAKARKSTIYDVARAAGTSTATVSRVFGDSEYPVSRELRLRVLSAAQKLEYTQASRMQQSPMACVEIGLIVPNVSNPYFWQIAMGIEDEMEQRGGSLFLCNSARKAETELKYLKSLMKKGVNGVLLASVSSDHAEIAELQKHGLRLVILDQSAGGLDCSKVGFNYLRGGEMAVEYLAGMGHRRIAFVSAPLVRESRNLTLSGYKLGLMSAGIPFSEQLLLVTGSEETHTDGYYEYELGRRSAKRLLSTSPLPSAAFCLNDMIALGLISALQDAGLSVPGDISVMGFDNIQASGMIRPALTTISQPSYETGRMAYKILMDNLMNASSSNVVLTLEPELIVRDSVARRVGGDGE